MSQVSPAARAHDARPVILIAALVAVIAGAALSSAVAFRSGPALASIPRLGWANSLARRPSPALAADLAAAATTAPAAPFVLTATGTERERALRCLTDAVYYEAALEPEDGQRAVAQVVLNRMRDPNFPKSICGVVFQGWNQPPGCQFSFTCDGSLARAPMALYWNRARRVAEAAVNGYVMAQVGTATHYHTDYVSPWWRTTVVRIAQVGAHIFYRWPGAAGLPGAFTGRYAGGESRISEAVLTGRALPPKVIAAANALKASQEGAPVQTIVVADPTAPGGVSTRIHAVVQMPGARPVPTRDQVAQINAIIERRFPTPEAAPAPPSASPANERAPVAVARDAKADAAAPVQTGGD